MYTPVRKIRTGYLLPESCKAAEGHRAIASLEAELPCLQLPRRGVPAQPAGAGERGGTLLRCATCANAAPRPHEQLCRRLALSMGSGARACL